VSGGAGKFSASESSVSARGGAATAILPAARAQIAATAVAMLEKQRENFMAANKRTPDENTSFLAKWKFREMELYPDSAVFFAV
jgi:hypothetical protein